MKNRGYQNILKHFKIEETILQVHPFGTGHINDTFKVELANKNYILQKINTVVFSDIKAMMENIQKVSFHLQKKNRAHENAQFLYFHTTLTGQPYFIEKKGEYWRLMDFIEDSHCYEKTENQELAYQGGLTIGRFLYQLADFPVSDLNETLPKFHHIKFRINQLLEALKQNSVMRADSIKREIDFALERIPIMLVFLQFVKDKDIPLRALHNDTKISNILFDAQGKGICMIDLDTLMPGYVHYDYGDAVRTFCSTANEDEVNLSKIDFKQTYYQAFTQGFLQETNTILTSDEKASLDFAPKLLTYIMGIRFLTDYLKGDTYYKIKYTQHNLDRARNQFHLLQKMESLLSNTIIDEN